MSLNLKQFLEYYDVFYKNDFEAIVGWAAYNGCQSELISTISALASSMVEDKKALEYQIREWSSCAMQLVPTISADTDFTTCINALRLAYFAYDGDQFIKIADDIMKANCITWAIVEDMHPMIWLKYKNVSNNG